MTDPKPLSLRDQVETTASALEEIAGWFGTGESTLRSHAADLRASAEAEKPAHLESMNRYHLSILNGACALADKILANAGVKKSPDGYNGAAEQAVSDLGDEIERLKAVNAGLLTALVEVSHLMQSDPNMSGNPRWHFRACRGVQVEQVCAQVKAAIARKEGGS